MSGVLQGSYARSDLIGFFLGEDFHVTAGRFVSGDRVHLAANSFVDDQPGRPGHVGEFRATYNS